MLDAFTYAGNRANLDAGPRGPAAARCRGRHPATRAAVGRAACRASTPSSTSPPSRTSTARSRGAADFVRDQRARHPDRCSTPRCASGSAASCTSPPTRSTARSPRARGPRRTRWSRTRPYAAQQGRQRPHRPRLRPHARARRVDHPLLEQLRARTSSPRRSSRCSSPTCSTAARVPLYGDGAQRPRLAARRRPLPRHRSWCSTRGRAGEVYNIGGGTELTNQELTERLLDGLRRRLVAGATTSPDRLGHDRRYSVDSTKIREELGYAPQVPFEQGLADTVAVVPRQPGLVGAAQAPRRAGPVTR